MKKLNDPAGPTAANKATGPGASPAPALPTLLYVEDNDDNWDVTLLRLKNRYTMYRAKNGEEACRWVKTLSSKLAVVLMDIQLQGSEMDGLRLTKLFRGTLNGVGLPPYAKEVPRLNVPIVFVTANGARHSETELLAAGGSFVVAKPVDFVRLTVGLNALLLKQRMPAATTSP